MFQWRIKGDKLNDSYETEKETRSVKSALIGKKPEHYIPIFERLDKSGDISWNWCGCFFAPFWFAYRKLYVWSAIAIAVPVLFLVICSLVLLSLPMGFDEFFNSAAKAAGLVYAIIFGLLANKVYKKRIDKLAAEIPPAGEEREQYIKSKGGVSIPALVIVILINMAITAGLYVL